MFTLLAFMVSVGLAALISKAIAKSRNDGRTFSIPAFVLVFVVMFVIVSATVRVWRADWMLRQIPVYKALAVSDPTTYQSIRKVVIESETSHGSEAEMQKRIGAILSQTLPTKIPRASDESVLAFAGAMEQTLNQMSRLSPDSCYLLLHPEMGGTGNIPNNPDFERNQQLVLSAMAQMVESASRQPQPPPDPDKGNQLTQTIFGALRAKYGNDVALLGNGVAITTVDRKKVCEMSADMFREIIQMPKADGSMTLRYLLTHTSSR